MFMEIYKQVRNWAQYEVLLSMKYRPVASRDVWRLRAVRGGRGVSDRVMWNETINPAPTFSSWPLGTWRALQRRNSISDTVGME